MIPLVFVQITAFSGGFPMLYHSTRSESLTASSAQAVVQGLAGDGGLYMPQAIPEFDWRGCLTGTSQEMATAILHRPG